MKRLLLFSVLTVLFFFISEISRSQTCISDADVGYSWTNLPYFDGADSYVTVNELNANSANNASYWFTGSFSFDLWLKCTWSEGTTSDDEYFFFSAGPWDDDNNSMLVYFERTSGTNWRIRISDGNDDGGNSDIMYYIDYANDFKDEWVHLTLTYDDTNVRLYKNSVLVKTQNFVFNKIPDEYCMLGGHASNHSEDFRGYISGFRIWRDKKLTDSEIAYIWDKTFHEQQTMKDEFEYLYQYLTINMFTSTDNVYSLIENKSMVEHGVTYSTNQFHPGRAINAYNGSVTANFDDIYLEWDSNTSYTTHYIYRSIEGGSYDLLCRTTENYYLDDSPTLLPGVNYNYYIRTYWRHPQKGFLHSQDDIVFDNVQLKQFENVSGLVVTEDAASQCNGTVKLAWNQVTEPEIPSTYTLYANIDGGGWNALDNNISALQYTHFLNVNDLGKQIQYRVDANGDQYANYSSIRTGAGNTECTTSPTNVVASLNNDVFVVDWDFTQTGAPATAFRIYRKIGSGTFELVEEDIDINSRTFTDYAESCVDHAYKVEAYNQCGANGSMSLASNTVYKPMVFDNVFTYDNGDGTKSFFDASKGYYSTKVLLEWDVNPNKKADIDEYEIYRRKQGQSFSLLTSIANQNASYFEDNNTEANVFYEYMIRAKGVCNSITEYSDSLFTTGFRYSSGIVSGKITYAGGNAVENVEVRISTSENISSGSLNFDGVNNFCATNSFLDDSLYNNPLSVEAWIKPELMMSGERNVIFALDRGIFYLALQNMRPIVAVNEHHFECSADPENPYVQLEGDTVLEADTWVHIAADLDPVNGVLRLFINGELIGTSEYESIGYPWVPLDVDGVDCGPTQESWVTLGIAYGSNTLFKGNIDEVRVFSRSRSSDEIAQDYVRILTGSEEGLIGYYRMDENFGYGAYDLSYQNNEFNKNDFELFESTGTDSWPSWSSETPSFEQLHPSGITNENGNYTIKGIRYSGSGNVFSVSPFLGIHEFNPADINLFVGDGDPVHNNIDFIDESSFTFTGTVYYEGTNLPVEGADIYIDNNQQFDAGGNPVQTNQYGQISISVPIGNHFISVKKDGHTFANNGQWPMPTQANPYNTFNFQENVNNITFYDQTKVRLAGRFVGGDVEGDKTLGFNRSNANIGQGNIVFKNEAGYDINTDPDVESSAITIQTNSNSGEYVVELLPVAYKIDSVWNDAYQISGLDLGVIDLSEIPDPTVVYDTTYNEEVDGEDTIINQIVNQFSYHFKRNFIHYEEPSIQLFGVGDNPLIGEEFYYYSHQDSEDVDTIDLVNDSPFSYPVFVMGNTYDISIRVEAIYVNYDSAEPEYDTVPVKDAQVSITNNIEIGEPAYSLTTDDAGLVYEYRSFKAGLPNMNLNTADQTSFTKTMTITAQAGNFNVAWNGGNVYRAYVLGGVDAGGVNYVTYGPEIPKFILRDPPGDRSYTSLEQGSSFSSSRDFSFNTGGTSVYDNVLMRGVKFEAGGGLAGPVFTSEVQSDINAGISTTSWVDRNGEFMETYTFNQTYSTSDDPNAVGSMADVYIGKSVNLFFTETQNLRIYPKSYCTESGLDYLENDELADPAAEFSIGKRPGFAVTDDPSSTFFIYSQDHILNSLLPTYRELIYTLLGTAKYESKVDADHLYYGFANDNPIWADTIAETGDTLPSYVFLGEQDEIDSVAMLNQQISIWLQTIAFNEASKLQSDMDEVENISFDGNAGAYTNEVQMTTSDVYNKEYFYRFELFGGAETGFSINKNGLMTYSQTYKNVDQSIGQTDTEQKSLKWKYVIDDSNQSDYYSIDVMTFNNGTLNEGKESFLNSNNYDDPGYNMGNLGLGTGIGAVGSFLISQALTKLVNPLAGQAFSMAYTIATAGAYMGVMAHYSTDTYDNNVYFGLQGASPMFRIMGGQSRCPYEGEEYTVFYIDSTSHEPFLLHPGTQNHESPKIEIEPASIVDVPDGSPAVFELKLMNESPTGADLTYELRVDEASNPDGAELRIDGINPNRPFFIPAGQTLTKTLTVERGASSVMNYDDLQLILHSTCQYNPDDNYPDIADTVAFSAHFIPICTEVDFGNVDDGWVSNVYNNNSMSVIIDGYNINQANFEKIYFQYQQSGATPTTAVVLYNDTISTDWAEYNGNKLYIDNQASITYNWNTASLNDGEYTLFLTSTCSDGSYYESPHYTGTIDRVTPRPFGTPQPSDGVLSFGEDISVQFNETINQGELYNFGQYGSASYISLRGMLNGTDLADSPYLLHDASLHFDGEDDYLGIPNVNLDHTDFTIEFWAKRQALGRECIISQANGLWIGFDENNYFVIEKDGQSVVSDEQYSFIDQWMFYSIVYDRGDDTNEPAFTLLILSDDTGTPQVVEFDIYTSMEGDLIVGYCDEDASAFTGNIHEFRIWNYARQTTDIASQKSRILNGYEEGLYGLWPLNESFGEFAHDIAFGRTANVNASWTVSRDGKALNFDGTNCFPVPAGAMAFNNQADFTIEFWFKSDVPTSNESLISNGVYENDMNVNAWNIYLTPEAKIEIANKDDIVSIDAEEYIDNNWHHFAMSLNRIGYFSLYLDGDLVETVPPTDFGGFGASKFVAGAKWYNLAMIDYFDDYFHGVMDEIRVWNAARTQSQIERYMNYSLSGDEPGLKAYFPFEDVTLEDPSISNENSGNFTLDTIGIAGDTLLPVEVFTLETPKIKLQRPEILIPHTLVINDDQVIIEPNVDDVEIENQILDISIKRVKDMFGNEMASTLSWNAFVDRNQVVWDMQELNVEKYIEQETVIHVNIRNNGGLNESWDITNIPDWMDVQPASGVLLPQTSQEIEIRILPQLNIGLYQWDLNLVASMDYNERLALRVKVKGHEPDWSVNPENFQLTASLVGQLSISDVLSTDTDDIVACFVDGECRGVSYVQYLNHLDMYLVFMNIYANENGENITFKVFDASSGEVYSNVTPNLIFTENALYGSVQAPISISAYNYVEQSIDLQTGWNWLSFNVYADEFNDLGLAFHNLDAVPRDFIKSQDQFASVVNTMQWFGNLHELNNYTSYKMKVHNEQTLVMEGYRVLADTIDIQLVAGWNWIAFPVSSQMPVDEALSSLTPQDNDVIKSQHAFAIYSDPQGWIGSLSYMKPGEGYIIKLASDDVLEYNPSVSYKSISNNLHDEFGDLPATESNMTIVARLDIEDARSYRVKAYDDQGMCAYADPVQLSNGELVWFVTVNSSQSQEIRFEVESSNDHWLANEQIIFAPDTHLGSLESPFVLSFGESQTVFDLRVYPNPFKDKLFLNVNLEQNENLRVELVNSLGEVLYNQNFDFPAGQSEIELLSLMDANRDLSSGMYSLKIRIGNELKYFKIVKQ